MNSILYFLVAVKRPWHGGKPILMPTETSKTIQAPIYQPNTLGNKGPTNLVVSIPLLITFSRHKSVWENKLTRKFNRYAIRYLILFDFSYLELNTVFGKQAVYFQHKKQLVYKSQFQYTLLKYPSNQSQHRGQQLNIMNIIYVG